MLNLQGGWKCESCGFKPKDPSYINLMAMKPRMDKLVIQEKQPPESLMQPMWISPQALAALQTRFPSNFRTTIWSLFNELAQGAIVLEVANSLELKELGVTKGRDIVGLAKTNLALTEQLKQMSEQMKQYEMLSRLMAVAQGGLANTPAAQSPLVDQILNPTPERPPQQPVMPVVSTESDVIYEPVAAGSFSDGTFGSPVALPPTTAVPAALRPPGMPKPMPAAR